MGYSKDVYESAMGRLSDRRSRALREARLRREMLEAKFPRIAQIEGEIARTGARTARIIITGGASVSEQIEQLARENLAQQQELKQLLAAAGVAEDYMEPRYFCAKCRDEGYVDGRMCVCLKQLLREEAYNKLNRLSPLELCGFENFDLSYYSDEPNAKTGKSPRKKMEENFRFCKKYAETFSMDSSSLLMSGATGLGKTHLSLAIAREAIARGYGVVYGSAQNLIAQLERERFGKAQPGEDSAALLLECDLLILDDLGTEFITPFVTSAIYNVVNTRLITGRPTIINTNLSLQELESKYSERIISRIMGGYRVLWFDGRDVRLLKRLRDQGRG